MGEEWAEALKGRHKAMAEGIGRESPHGYLALSGLKAERGSQTQADGLGFVRSPPWGSILAPAAPTRRVQSDFPRYPLFHDLL